MKDFIKVNNLKKSFNKKEVLTGLSFNIKEQELVGIIGRSASGKTTFLKCLSGVYEDYSGDIKWCKDSAENFKPEIGYLFQEGGLFDSLDVINNVMFPIFNTKSGFDKFSKLCPVQENIKSFTFDKAKIILEKVGLSKAIFKSTSELSGGMRKRVGIARALISNPDLLLLDDPTAGLDPVTANSILDLVTNLASETKCTTIIVSHDLRRLIPRVNRLIMFSKDGMVQDDYSNNEIPKIEQIISSFKV